MAAERYISLYLIDSLKDSESKCTSCKNPTRSPLLLAYASEDLATKAFLFSAHISYGKGKYLNQTGFFYKICQELLFT